MRIGEDEVGKRTPGSEAQTWNITRKDDARLGGGTTVPPDKNKWLLFTTKK